MEDILRDPVELLDEDLDIIAGGLDTAGVGGLNIDINIDTAVINQLIVQIQVDTSHSIENAANIASASFVIT